MNAASEKPGAKSTIFAYIPRLTEKFGVGLPPMQGEDPFATWARAFVEKAGHLSPEYANLAEEDPAELVNMMIEQFDGVFVLVLEGQTSVFSLRRRNKLPQEFTSKLRQMVGISPNDKIGWYRSIDAQPVEVLAAEALYGMEDADVEHERNRPMPRFVKPKNREQVAALRRRFWSGRTDPGHAEDIVDILLANQ